MPRRDETNSAYSAMAHSAARSQPACARTGGISPARGLPTLTSASGVAPAAFAQAPSADQVGSRDRRLRLAADHQPAREAADERSRALRVEEIEEGGWTGRRADRAKHTSGRVGGRTPPGGTAIRTLTDGSREYYTRARSVIFRRFCEEAPQFGPNCWPRL